MNWISVHDSLPKEDESVLIYFPEVLRGESHIDLGFLYEGCWYYEYGWTSLANNDISHWMPLPDPPSISQMNMAGSND